MGIDPAKVRSFWEARAAKLNAVPYESIANLEEDPGLLALKVELETECVLPRLVLGPETRILDLGAGVGQWAFRFAPRVREVVAVEYAAGLAEIARREAERLELSNVEYVVSPAESYASPEPFDVVFVSGLFVYLADEQVRALLARLPELVRPGGQLFVRDGASVLDHEHLIDDRESAILGSRYSARYRTVPDYLAMFARVGFSAIEHGPVFPEGCPLNKFPETRLWFFDLRDTPEAKS